MAAYVVFLTDMHRDDLDDYLVLDPVTGALSVWLNEGRDSGFASGWKFKEMGQIASGLGPGARVRMADIDGDGVGRAYSGGYGLGANIMCSSMPTTSS